ncbi:MAG: type II toxin-antitoxin system RatA family toxin [Pseudomonadales bacterium]|nr:type II toxin-antitoxin system RatA family toxin [Pseudomonadales bacterium]
MNHINRSALLPYSDKQMYALVNNVADYPLYMDGCGATEILEVSDVHMVATLKLEKKGIKMQFTTRNQLDAPKSIVMGLEDGPFESFEGRWFFQHLNENACKVILDIQFSLSSRVKGMAARKLFDAVSNNMVDSVVKRAKHVYGK